MNFLLAFSFDVMRENVMIFQMVPDEPKMGDAFSHDEMKTVFRKLVGEDMEEEQGIIEIHVI